MQDFQSLERVCLGDRDTLALALSALMCSGRSRLPVAALALGAGLPGDAACLLLGCSGACFASCTRRRHHDFRSKTSRGASIALLAFLPAVTARVEQAYRMHPIAHGYACRCGWMHGRENCCERYPGDLLAQQSPPFLPHAYIDLL